MSMNMAESLQGLSALLGGSYGRDHEEELEELESGGKKPAADPFSSMNPGSIGPAKKSAHMPGKAEPQSGLKSGDKDIWAAEDVAIDDHGAEDDPRPQPEYDILYKQAVTSEDMFLQMSGRDPSTHWCDDMVIKIKLPNHKMKDCELEVEEKFLDLRTPSHRLGLHLPHPCDKDKGSAKFDTSKSELVVTLRLDREMDFLKQDNPF